MAHVNVSGIWKEEGSTHVNVSGIWKTGSTRYVNVSGIWKEEASGKLSFRPNAYHYSSSEYISSCSLIKYSDRLQFNLSGVYTDDDPAGVIWSTTNKINLSPTDQIQITYHTPGRLEYLAIMINNSDTQGYPSIKNFYFYRNDLHHNTSGKKTVTIPRYTSTTMTGTVACGISILQQTFDQMGTEFNIYSITVNGKEILV